VITNRINTAQKAAKVPSSINSSAALLFGIGMYEVEKPFGASHQTSRSP